jgi:hypothetical protein
VLDHPFFVDGGRGGGEVEGVEGEGSKGGGFMVW